MPEAALAGFRVVFWRGYVGGRQNCLLIIVITKGARLGFQFSGAPELTWSGLVSLSQVCPTLRLLSFIFNVDYEFWFQRNFPSSCGGLSYERKDAALVSC